MNALEGGGESVMGQQDGGDHVERVVVVVSVRGWVGTELEASEGVWLRALRERVEYETVWAQVG